MSDQKTPHAPLVWSTTEELERDPDALARQGGGDWNSKPKGFQTPLGELSLPEMNLRRRDFLKLSGFAAVLAAVGCYERPESELRPYVVQPEEVTGGIPNYYSSTCQGCSAACGIVVKTYQGRPIKLEGNPFHPVNHGALCSKGQAQVLGLYDPDRLRRPGRIKAGELAQEELDWDVAYAELADRLKSAKNPVLLTTSIHGPARTELLARFKKVFPKLRHVSFEAFGDNTLLRHEEAVYGKALRPRYRFDKCETVVLLGADPMSQGGSPLEYQRGLGGVRKVRRDDHGHVTMGKVFAFEPVMTLSGMNADERYPVRPDQMLDLALALAAQLAADGHVVGGANVANIARNAADPAAVEAELGLPKGVVKRCADQLWASKGKSLVYSNSLMNAMGAEWEAQLALTTALLNAMLGNDGETIERSRPANQLQGSPDAFAGLMEEMKAGEVDVLLVADANPAYSLPESADFADAMRRVAYSVSFSSHLDETARLCRVALPGLHFLENWGDAEPYAGIYSIQQPAIGPIWNNRAMEDSLIAVAKKAGGTEFDIEKYKILRPALQGAQGNPPPLPDTPPWYDFVRNVWSTTVREAVAPDLGEEEFWHDCLRKGVAVAEPKGQESQLNPGAVKLASADERQRMKGKAGQGLTLVTYAMPNLGDGRFANNPWLLELPDPVSRICWDNFAAVSYGLAKREKLKDGDVIELTANGVTKRVPVRILFGAHQDVIGVGTGWGREHAGTVRDEDSLSFNAFEYGRVVGKGDSAHLVYSGALATIKKTGDTYRLADIMGHNYLKADPADAEEFRRPIVQEVALEDYLHDDTAAQPPHHIPYHKGHDPYDSLWGETPAEDRYWRHKWHMTIDLNACTGCNACMVACQAENNIPVVGKREVLVGREMHWIRIDRYYKANEDYLDNPDVLKHPMLCQHCDNAPCETVCPVLATVHNDEGLNTQIYNRCVGTRYCANNCPYKVRRFNFYQYSDYRRGPHFPDQKLKGTPLIMALNPEVTVRTKGIMEKCTFCYQRIADAKWHAKQEKRNIREGEVLTACQQTCPTQAINFGDALNPEHSVNTVYKEHAYRLGFKVLDETNTRPNVLYLAQVRNRAPGAWDKERQAEKHHGYGDDHGKDGKKGHGKGDDHMPEAPDHVIDHSNVEPEPAPLTPAAHTESH
ncbi:MAG: 4Fe-4S dicluster domain-containing protein [Sumerlaeia bacterium]